nr:hypothetical protein [uncultured Rhodopila sp.]
MPLVVNRAPVLTLWAAVVAEHLGHPADTALTLGRVVAGSAARVKARNIGREERKADRDADTPELAVVHVIPTEQNSDRSAVASPRHGRATGLPSLQALAATDGWVRPDHDV